MIWWFHSAEYDFLSVIPWIKYLTGNVSYQFPSSWNQPATRDVSNAFIPLTNEYGSKTIPQASQPFLFWESKQGIFDCLSCTETERDSRLWGVKQSFFLYHPWDGSLQKSVTPQFIYIMNVLSTQSENRFSFGPLLLNRLCLTCCLWFVTVFGLKVLCMKTKRTLCQLKETDGLH